MTFEQLKQKVKVTPPQSQTHNPHACAYPDRPSDAWDDEDEIEWLAGYSFQGKTPKDEKKEEKKEETETPDEKEVGHFWQALLLLAECRGAFELILQLDLRKDFLSPQHHKDISDTLMDVEKLMEDYNVEDWSRE